MLCVLYLGDIMGKPGRDVVQALLPGLRQEHAVDLVMAQAENVSHGRGMSPAHMRQLQQAGVDFFTGGNHTMERDVSSLLGDPNEPIIAPINQPGVEKSWGAKIIHTQKGDVVAASLLGTTFPQLKSPMQNPLEAADNLLKEFAEGKKLVATIVNFHGDWSSEKRVIGYYLDGKVSAVIGDHWHVPTADAMVLPHGTAHITDVGMCGTLHSSLGVSKELIINRWRHGEANKNEIASEGPFQLNAVLVTIDESTGLAQDITQIQKIVEKL